MKRLCIVLCCLILTGCNNNKQLDLYNHFIDGIDTYKQNNNNIPFDITVSFDKITDDEVTYRVIIDNPKEALKNIKAIATHNLQTSDIYPTSGIFEEPLHLIPNDVDLDHNKAKGIILIGYIDYKGKLDDFKVIVNVLVEYEDALHNVKKIYYKYQK